MTLVQLPVRAAGGGSVGQTEGYIYVVVEARLSQLISEIRTDVGGKPRGDG
jgi:hypothetical protein